MDFGTIVRRGPALVMSLEIAPKSPMFFTHARGKRLIFTRLLQSTVKREPVGQAENNAHLAKGVLSTLPLYRTILAAR
ncbi:hypothetical protein LNP02_19305 [Klebsiella variicola subsp. variicola]|nr:hypothetical protein [Klebsiella variicola subsp. variicola]